MRAAADGGAEMEGAQVEAEGGLVIDGGDDGTACVRKLGAAS